MQRGGRVFAPKPGEVLSELNVESETTHVLEATRKQGPEKPKKIWLPSPEIKRTTEAFETMKHILDGLTTDLPFTMNALQVVGRRYLLRTHDGKIRETPEQMFRRVARALADVEKVFYGKSDSEVEEFAREFEDVLMNFQFTPAGRTLANAGGPTRVVSNCIVLHIEDSMESIFTTLRDASLLQQHGSGLGFPFHLLRPAGSICKATFGISSGPLSFLDVYNSSFAVIQQQNRHGANMAVMRVDHPDILEFIHCKDREGDLRNFNVSVAFTDEFMRRVRDNDPEPWICTFGEGEKRMVMKPRTIRRGPNFRLEEVKEVDMTASEIFDAIVDGSWRTGEPGIIFIDTVNKTNALPGLGRIESCNPCGEQYLHDGDVCNLGAINLAVFLGKDENDKPAFDYERLCHVTEVAVRMLDNVVDITDFPVKKVNDTFRGNRRIGLGVMGFADVLYQLGIGYNTEDGLETAEKIMGTIQETAHEISVKLGREKGVFPYHRLSVFVEEGLHRRNAAVTNVAPTGTISMMFDVAGGVEPFFALAYHYRGILGGHVNLTYVNKYLKQALMERGLFSNAMMDRIIKEGSIQNIDEIPDDLKKVFVTAMDIKAEDHIRMQAAFQKHVDNAISKTINFPNSATSEDIKRGFILAWEMGCKGCTAYRDGSRQEQVLNLDAEMQNAAKKEGKDIAAKEMAPLPRAGNKKVTQCPDCKEKLAYVEGCCLCHNCGYSACSR